MKKKNPSRSDIVLLRAYKYLISLLVCFYHFSHIIKCSCILIAFASKLIQ